MILFQLRSVCCWAQPRNVYFCVLQLVFPLKGCAVARTGHTGILLNSWCLNMPKETSSFSVLLRAYLHRSYMTCHPSAFSHNLLSECQSPAIANSKMANLAGKEKVTQSSCLSLWPCGIDSANAGNFHVFIICLPLVRCSHCPFLHVSGSAVLSCSDSGTRQRVNAAHVVTLMGLVCLQACQKEQVI